MKVLTTKGIKRFVNILIYSEAGWGKTFQCCRAPSPILLSAEGGLLSLSDQDVPMIEVQTMKQAMDFCDWLDTSKEATKYETICVDSLSEIAELVLAKELKGTKDARQAYGQLNMQMQDFIRRVNATKKDGYFTAKMKRETTPTGAVRCYPSAPGQSQFQSLPFFFDVLLVGLEGKLKDGTRYKYIQTNETRQYNAKERSGCLKNIVAPDLGAVINTIKAGKRLTEQEKI